MSENKLRNFIRPIVSKIVNECECQHQKSEKPFYYLAPNVVGSINNYMLDTDKGTFDVYFSTVDGDKLNLNVKDDTFYKWAEDNATSGEGDLVMNFLKNFLEGSKPIEDDEMIDEIVDDSGNLIGSKDKPNNATNTMVGNSVFDTDKVVKQSLPKSRRYYNDYGLGIITW